MDKGKNREPEIVGDNKPVKTNQWIDKAEAFIDEAADKIHQSEAYRKAGKTAESVTKKLFSQAGKWWGKSQQNFKG
jgi:hypothetical protein